MELFTIFHQPEKLYLMNQLKIFVAAILLCNTAFADDVKTIASSDVKSVKVFLTQAQVMRTFRTTVAAGTTQVVVRNLSSQIIQESINVSGTGNATILSVSYSLDYLSPETKSPEILTLEDSLENLKYKQSQLLNYKSSLQEEQNVLLANKNISGANVGVKADELLRVSQAIQTRIADIKQKILDNEQKEEKLKKQIQRINNQLSVLNNKLNQPTGSIAITINAAEATTANFEMSYAVNGAGWTPAYDIRVKGLNEPVQIIYRANVHQTTGENWDKVKLSLSTGNPQLSGVKPELYTWYLNYYQPVFRQDVMFKSMMPASAAEGRNENQATAKDKEESAPMQSISDQVTVDASQLDIDFAIPVEYSIPSDGKNVLVEIQNKSLPAQFRYYAIPKLDADAFLTAEITGWQDLNLIPGNSTVFFEGTYVGESFIDPRNTNDTLQLSLGRDKRVVVKREKLKDLTANQFIGSNKTKTLGYEFSIRNTRKEKINLVMQDQIPVSQQKDIEVSVNEKSGGDLNTDTGTVKWELAINPGETVKKKFSFTVKYPKDKVLGGL